MSDIKISLSLVEEVPSFVKGGFVYTDGREEFLVYTGSSGKRWNACRTNGDREFTKDIVVLVPGKAACLAELRDVLQAEAEKRWRQMVADQAESWTEDADQDEPDDAAAG